MYVSIVTKVTLTAKGVFHSLPMSVCCKVEFNSAKHLLHAAYVAMPMHV